MIRRTRTSTICLGILLGMLPLYSASAQVEFSFLYPLSNFSGTVPSMWAKVAVDPERDDVYVLNQRDNEVRIFNESGMEIFAFGEGFPGIRDISIGPKGDIFLLGRGRVIQRCNYRGELLETITLKDIPDKYSKFTANQMVYRNESLYLVDSGSSLIMIFDEDGHFENAYGLAPHFRRYAAGDVEKRKMFKDVSIGGFDVDQYGNMFFTVPSSFSAFRLSAEGELTVWGKPGSAKGKFGVVGGIATDDMGNVYVSDRLRCTVLVFSRDLVFQGEFGGRGSRASNLIVPNDLAIDRSGKIYVAQAANRGVSVFKVVYERLPSIEESQLGDIRLERTKAEVDPLNKNEEMKLRN